MFNLSKHLHEYWVIKHKAKVWNSNWGKEEKFICLC